MSKPLFNQKTAEELEQQAEDAYAALLLEYFRMRKAGFTQLEYDCRETVISILLQDQHDMRKRAKELGIKF